VLVIAIVIAGYALGTGSVASRGQDPDGAPHHD
jgi:hypothetical protein